MTMRRGEQLLSAVFSAYWAMDEAKYDAMIEVLDRWADGQKLSAEEIQARTGASERKRATPATGSAIAVLPLHGLISHRAHMVEDTSFGSGGTSTERFGQLFDAALRDPEVGSIVIDVDSPGGNVAGVPELAQKIFAARGQKRIIAVANSLAASAAYWICTAADETVAIPSGEVGSVGVFAMHTNTARRDANVGVERTILRADIGPNKAELSPHGPLSGPARSYVQEQLNDLGLQFVDALARHLGVSASVVRERFGGGRTMSARQALAAGMVRRIATLEEVLADLGVSATADRKPASRPKAVDERRDAATDDALPIAAAADVDAAPDVASSIRSLTDRAVAALAPAKADLTLLRPDADGAAPAASSSPVQEIHVSDNKATAPTGAPDASAIDELARLRAARARETEIRNYCTLIPGVSATEMNAFLSSDKSAEQVRQELAGRQEKPKPAAITSVHDRILDKKFTSVGEQLVAIMATRNGKTPDPRLLEINAVSGSMNEQIGSEGAFLIQQDQADGTMASIFADDPILSRVDRMPMTRPSRKVNLLDESSRATGSRWGGISMQWLGPGQEPAKSKPKTRRVEYELKKLTGLCWFDDEEMEDAPVSAELADKAFRAEAQFMLANSVFRGSGAGMPKGFKDSAATVTIGIEVGQTIANTPASIAINTTKMLSRIPPSLQKGAIYLYNTSLLPSIVTATVGNTAIFVPGGGMAQRPNDTIWGKPAFGSELCEAVGTPGDIVCLAPSEYTLADKGGPRRSFSIEAGWLTDQSALKIVIRVDGQPTWDKAVTPFKGADSWSPYVLLNTRA